MAKFNAVGFRDVELSFAEFAALPDEVIDEMLDAQSRVVVLAHKAKINSLGLVDSGKLLGSIKAHKKAGGGRGNVQRYVLIYPEGTHHTYSGVEKTKTYANSKHDRTYTTGGGERVATNNDVGFIHEFGAPKRGIKASQWMKSANEECADNAVSAALVVYDEFLNKQQGG